MNITEFSRPDLQHLPQLQPPGWPDIRLAYEYYLSAGHCRPIKAVNDGVLLGVGSAISLAGTGWLGHVVVRPGHRRQGIGSLIVEDLIRYLRLSGSGTISLVATDEGYSVYERLGFVPLAGYLFYERPEGGGFAPAELQPASRPLPAATQADLEAILAVDRDVSGEDRRMLLVDQVGNMTVYRDGRGIGGFYCPGLGEGLIVALDPEAGAVLLASHIQTSNRVALPALNAEGARMLREAGFTEVRRSTRMVLGNPFRWRPECIYSRIGGHLG